MPDTIDHGNAFSVPASGNGQRHGSLPNDDDEWDKWGAGGEPLNWDPAPCDAEQPQPPVAAPASMPLTLADGSTVALPLTQPGNRVITPAELAAASERGKAIVGIALRNRELRPVLLGEHDICSTLASVCGDWGGVLSFLAAHQDRMPAGENLDAVCDWAAALVATQAGTAMEGRLPAELSESLREAWQAPLAAMDGATAWSWLGSAAQPAAVKFIADRPILAATDMSARILRGLAALSSRTPRAARGGDFTFYTRRDLEALPLGVNYLIEDFLVAGEPCILGGKSKTLKTSMALAMAIALAHGRRFLGRFAVPQAVPTTFISGESGLAFVRDTLQRIERSEDVGLLDHLYISANLPVIAMSRDGKPTTDSQRSLDALGRALERQQSKVLFLDPAYLCLDVGDDAGNLFSMGKRLRPLDQCCRSRGVTLVLLHHVSKTSGKGRELEPPERDDLAFAGFSEYAAQWLLLGRREPYADGSGHHELWLRYGGRAGHEGLLGLDIRERRVGPSMEDPRRRIWQVSVANAPEIRLTAAEEREREREARKAQRQADRLAEDCQAVIAAIRRVGVAGVTRIRDAANLNSERTRPAISHLLDTRQIVLIAGEGRPRYRLPDSNRDDRDES